MWRFLFIAFLIAHGLIHLVIWVIPPKPKDEAARPFDPSHSWLLGDREGPARAAALAATVLLIAAGLGLWAGVDWWQSAAVAGLATSLGLMIVYFDRWFLFIEAVNAGLIVGILWLSWPSRAMVGA